MRIFWKTAITLACVGMVAPHPATWAGKTAANSPVQINDITLNAGGVLSGQVVDTQGKSLTNAPVVVKFGDKTIAKTKTNRHGRFLVKSLRGGVHQIVAGQGSSLCRFWTEKAAPPSARNSVVIVSDGSIVRGQGCATEPGCADEGCGAVAGASGCMLGGGAGGGGGMAGLGALGGTGGALALVAGVAVVGGVLAVTADDDDDAQTPASP